MGFRSVFITNDLPIKWPQWFKDKWNEWCFGIRDSGPFSSKLEHKVYMVWTDLEQDIMKALKELDYKYSFVMVYLHECRGITRVEIDKDGIEYSEPSSWYQTNDIGHYYCNGCSDIKNISLINKAFLESQKINHIESLLKQMEDVTRELANLTGFDDRYAKNRRKYLTRTLKNLEDALKEKQ